MAPRLQRRLNTEALMADEAWDEAKRTYMEAIRRHVCSVCLDSKDDGSCSLTGRVCAIDAQLPALVAAILATRSRRMDDYYDAIQGQVCPGCRQDQAGRCALRDAGDCALATYLPLVVDAIETVEGRELAMCRGF
jgi:hypothetical protein